MAQDPNTSDVEKKAGYGIEELQVAGEQLLARVQEIIREGNARRIIIRQGDRTLLEIPLTVGVIGAAAGLSVAPILVAVGAVGALLAQVTLQVVRKDASDDIYKADGSDYSSSTPGYTGTSPDEPQS